MNARARVRPPVRRRSSRRRTILIITGATLVALAAVLFGILINQSQANKTAGVPSADGPEGTRSFGTLAQTHVATPVKYPRTPPVGGPHSITPQNCGFYATPVKGENGVHSMEHGAVWITYRPGLAAEQAAHLRELAKQPYVLVSVFDGLPAPVVASAWSRQLRLQSADDPRLDHFLKTFVNGTQTPEKGAPCSGGVGSPQS